MKKYFLITIFSVFIILALSGAAYADNAEDLENAVDNTEIEIDSDGNAVWIKQNTSRYAKTQETPNDPPLTRIGSGDKGRSL